MAEFHPNDAQLSAIREGGKNILVSAGAGSGKTTVLVERVLRLIIEEQVDIGSLIIVTFTRAAASHMKDKIYSRIRTALQNEELSEETREHLRGQMLRVFSARICTIDALCMDIVKENFQYADVDPAFTIADEAENSLLMQDVLEQLIETHYAEPTDEFLEFVSNYTDKNDSKLEEIILTLYRFSQSHPEPEKWLRRSIGPYVHADQMGSVEDEAENLWMQELALTVFSAEEALQNTVRQAIAICNLDGGPEAYLPNLESLCEQLDSLTGECFDNKVGILNEILGTWKSLPRVKKSDDVDPDLKDAAKSLYGSMKKSLQTLSERFFSQKLETMFQELGTCAGVAQTIVSLTLEYSRMLAKEKKARLIADFSDVAHFALDVLVKRDEEGGILRDESGQMLCTEAADAYARQIHEIIVDEYQDTNRLQDALIEALSAERFGRPNVFMVGDVKQSIYGFRMACPDLFNEKYRNYAEGSGTGKRIILGENYRSRPEVVNFINYVFNRIMLLQVGGIDYEDGNQMIAGASFPEHPQPEQLIPELLFIDGGGEQGKLCESYEIAQKIEELVSDFWLTDEKTGELRKARYSDIAILTRRANQPKLEKMLSDRHIPVSQSSTKGFFGAFEIRLALNLLRIVDNPRQDIPFAAVLLSPVTGLNAQTLARIKAADVSEPFCLYEAAKSFAQTAEGEESELLRQFLEKLEDWRIRGTYEGMVPFLDELLEESGLACICSAMTYGEGRLANLNFLRGLSENYSKGSYTGLYHFIRYIEQIQKADMDFGSAGREGSDEDAVSLMTIHKSKGLEFPIVILADGGRLISDLDSAGPVYLDDTLGIGLERRDAETRLKRRTLLMETIAAKKKTSIFAEEIRLLYVAMSRAKEKLIITGSSGNLSKRRREWEQQAVVMLPDAGTILTDSSYLHLLGDAVQCADKKEQELFSWVWKDPEEVEIERAAEVFEELEQKKKIKELLKNAGTEVPDPQTAGIYGFEYPYRSATAASVKRTASQMEQHETDREQTEEAAERAMRFRALPADSLTGAERGNAYHKLFELLDYKVVDDLFRKLQAELPAQEKEAEQDAAVQTAAANKACTLPEGDEVREAADRLVSEQIRNLMETGHLTSAAAASIEPRKITNFLFSDLGCRMRAAALEGTLRREQQFVMAAEIDGNPDGLMQGIIDAFFPTDCSKDDPSAGKGIILVDYKTDRGRSEDYLIRTYRGQQEEYAKAIEGATGLPVLSKVLYSVDLDREIFLNEVQSDK